MNRCKTVVNTSDIVTGKLSIAFICTVGRIRGFGDGNSFMNVFTWAMMHIIAYLYYKYLEQDKCLCCFCGYSKIACLQHRGNLDREMKIFITYTNDF